MKRTSTNRVLFAGDAGGFVNGITAEGIYYAMVSGDLAARALLGAGPSAYRRLWTREIGGELRDAVLVQRDLLTTPERIDRLVAGTRGAPDLAAHVIQYAMGEISYQSARRRLLAAAPLAAVRLFIRHFRGTTVGRPELGAAQLPPSRIEI